MARKRVKLKSVKRLRPVKTRAAETATWSQTNGTAVRVRDMEDAHLLNTTHYVERTLVTCDNIYGELLKEARYRGLILRERS